MVCEPDEPKEGDGAENEEPEIKKGHGSRPIAYRGIFLLWRSQTVECIVRKGGFADAA
jgi:hypothetical protein